MDTLMGYAEKEYDLPALHKCLYSVLSNKAESEQRCYLLEELLEDWQAYAKYLEDKLQAASEQEDFNNNEDLWLDEYETKLKKRRKEDAAGKQ
jgi:hypothetical protein